MVEKKKASVDTASQALFEEAVNQGIRTAFQRYEQQQPQCGYGTLGLCCRHCAMGPCNIDPFGKNGPDRGVCGADADTIAARHFDRMIAAGAAAHSDHGRGVVEVFLAAAKGEAEGYEIKDEQKLLQLALDFDVEIGERDIKDIAIEVGEKALAQWGQQEGEVVMLKRAPLKRQKIWRDLGIWPRGVDREIVEIMHRTHIGVDEDPVNLIMQGARAALGDGWGGSMIATEIQDILFGTPVPVLAQANLGVLKEKEVNVVIHGHEPVLSEMIVAVAGSKEMLDYAKSKGAEGINLGGICCTANEILMRHGLPIAGDFLQQELALVTGAVDAMVVDLQCIMPGLTEVAQCFDTELISTEKRANIRGTTRILFEEDNAMESAKAIVKKACDAFEKRKGKKVHIPNEKTDLVAGFSHETIDYLLGGVFRSSYRPLNDNIINGRIRGIAGVVGCCTPKVTHNDYHVAMVKHLIKNNVIVLQTGCSAVACAKEGLMLPESAAEFAGDGLAEVCETVGIPPVLHMGSCVDNSRILMAAAAVVKEGGLGDDISDLPVAGAAPEWMSEKAISIGHYFVASGVYTVFSATWPTMGARKLTDFLFNGIEEKLGGKWDYVNDPIEAADKMIAHIDEKRAALGILEKKKERVLMDMAMRRELDAG
ncbi:MAG: anaerobic carbon-monoxide dehydrogenase catalytic subunit [Deltaproteobacteria bacterium]|nr:anaerobic carbon-monoxide dehydrogenase catalytic subunit [Deltaproteobacteria bacterium]